MTGGYNEAWKIVGLISRTSRGRCVRGSAPYIFTKHECLGRHLHQNCKSENGTGKESIASPALVEYPVTQAHSGKNIREPIFIESFFAVQ